jgi:hypothetical protein
MLAGVLAEAVDGVHQEATEAAKFICVAVVASLCQCQLDEDEGSRRSIPLAVQETQSVTMRERKTMKKEQLSYSSTIKRQAKKDTDRIFHSLASLSSAESFLTWSD